MDALKFTLSGKTAFFKKPDVNSYFYFTYGSIHKIALLGILGAIMGYGGYNQQSREENQQSYPEFYQRLKDIRLGISPKNQRGHIPKKIQTFNNSVGYANKDGNLIVKEQWLENPCWDIYILIQGSMEREIAENIFNARAVYLPYLGKNDHFADITETSLLKDIEPLDQPQSINSLFIKDYFQIEVQDRPKRGQREPIFKYEEKLPVSLEAATNLYRFSTFIYTNSQLATLEKASIYRCNEQNIFFF